MGGGHPAPPHPFILQICVLFFNCARWIVQGFFLSELQKTYNQRFWVGIIKLSFGQLLVRYLIYFARENRYTLLNLAPNICSPLPNNVSVNSKHQHPPRECFKVVKFPAPRAENFLRNTAPGQKKPRQKPCTWVQFCGPSRQFCHDCETIRIFLVLFFSLAFF